MQRAVVATGPISRAAESTLSPFGRIIIAADGSEESLLPLVDDAIAIVVRGDGVASGAMIERAKHLKVIGRTGVGYNNIDIEAATRREIPVVFTPGVNTRTVAEASIALLLAACKRIVYWDRQLKSGNWASRNNFSSMEMEGATLGIIGLGNIGRELALLARPFRMRLLAFDPYVDRDQAASLGVEMTGLEELLGEANYICLHAVLTDETRASSTGGTCNWFSAAPSSLTSPGVNLSRASTSSKKLSSRGGSPPSGSTYLPPSPPMSAIPSSRGRTVSPPLMPSE